MERDLIGEVLRNPIYNPHKEIRTKAHAYALYEVGLFGNKALTWKTLQDIRNLFRARIVNCQLIAKRFPF